MYKTARLTVQRFYIATKQKELEDDISDTSEVILVSEGTGSEINTAELQVEDVIVDLDGVQAAAMFFDSEITFGPLYDAEQDTEDTLIFDGFSMPASPAHPEDVITITVDHFNTLHDMITAFSDAEILNNVVNVQRIRPDNKKEAGKWIGCSERCSQLLLE